MPTYEVSLSDGRVLEVDANAPPSMKDIEAHLSAAAPAAPMSAAGEAATRRMAADEAKRNAPSVAGSFLRNARENIGAGLGGAGAGAVSGAVGGSWLGPWGTLGGAIIGGVGGGFAGQKIQEAVDPITQERQAALQLDRETNPLSSLAGAVAPGLITAKPSISNIGRAFTPMSRAATAGERAAILASRVDLGAEGAISAGFDVGQSLASGQPLDPRQIAFNAGAGMLFSKHNRLGLSLIHI